METKSADTTAKLLKPTLANVRLTKGWGDIGSWGVWGLDDQSTVDMFLPDAKPRTLFLECNAYPGLIDIGETQSMTLRFNSHEISKVQLQRRMKSYRIPIPADILKPGLNHLELSYSTHASPKGLGLGEDLRQLAIGLRKISLTAKAVDWSDAIFVDPVKAKIKIRKSGHLVISLPNRARDISFQAVFQGAAAGARCVVMEKLLSQGDETLQIIDQETLDSSTAHTTSVHWHGGESARLRGLVFDLHLPSDRGQLVIQSLKWTEVPVNPRNGSITPGPAEKSTPPDIVMIILDAARADHFGSPYGYHRNTTPNITSLAKKSLTFQQVTAIAPYTLCSVPTMITGLSFVSHGVVSHHLRLAEEVTTLAERLKEAGYQTLAFSGSPNNSIRLGCNQGYDEFFEAWKSVPQKVALDPNRIVDRVRQRLGHDIDGRPLHLMIHLVPPHAPYEPRRQFDIFGSPEYHGPCRGSNKFIEKVSRHQVELGPADLEELISLYDGNLLMADNAVGRILAEIRQKAHWPNVVVAITADHGEAFLEHGEQGHNSTVYEEMMRVPLVLRVPKGLGSPDIGLDFQVSLEDLTPTLLGLAGLKPDFRASGVDIFHSRDPQRWLFMRSASTNLRALRGFGWKLIMRMDGHHTELFDLRRDPHEQHDLSLSEPEFAALLGLKLLDEKNKFQTVAAQSPGAGLTKDDEDALRTLGYIQ